MPGDSEQRISCEEWIRLVLEVAIWCIENPKGYITKFYRNHGYLGLAPYPIKLEPCDKLRLLLLIKEASKSLPDDYRKRYNTKPHAGLVVFDQFYPMYYYREFGIMPWRLRREIDPFWKKFRTSN